MCTYKNQNYSEGSIVKFDDGHYYQCFQGTWRLWQLFKISASVSNNAKRLLSEVDDLIIFEKEEGKINIVSKSIGFDFTVGRKSDISYVNIIMSDGSTYVITHYNSSENYENYCCVSCGGTTACGQSACLTCGGTTVCC